jgi:ParB family chromosome partitioning protein
MYPNILDSELVCRLRVVVGRRRFGNRAVFYMNKLQTGKKDITGGQAGDISGGKATRRLGRGLSSLLSAPVKVEIETSDGVAAESPESESPPASARAGVFARGTAGPGATSTERVGGDVGDSGTSGKVGQRPPVEPGDRGGGVVMVAVGEIVPNRHQPRRKFEEAALGELAASIRSAGVVQPVLVRRVAPGTSSSDREGKAAGFELVAGERRWRAAQLAGLTRVPAVVAELSDEQAAEWALIENVQRTDLSAMETAYAVRELCERFKLTHAQAAEKLGLDRTSITNLVRLTDLEPEVRVLLEEGTLSAGHGKVLLGMAEGMRRASLAKRAAEAGWSVRRLGSAVSLMMKGAADDATEADAMRAAAQLIPTDAGRGGLARDSLAHAGMRELEKQLGEHLGTKVQIKVRQNGKRGALKIDFYDLDHFDGLMAKMGFVMQ